MLCYSSSIGSLNVPFAVCVLLMLSVVLVVAVVRIEMYSRRLGDIEGV